MTTKVIFRCLLAVIFFACQNAVCAQDAAPKPKAGFRNALQVSGAGYFNSGKNNAIVGSPDEVWPAKVFGQDVLIGYTAYIGSRWRCGIAMNWNRLPFDERYDLGADSAGSPDRIFTRGLPVTFSLQTVGFRADVGWRAAEDRAFKIGAYGFLAARSTAGSFAYSSYERYYPGGFSDTATRFIVHEAWYTANANWLLYFGCGVDVTHNFGKRHLIALALEGCESSGKILTGVIDFLPEFPARKRIIYTNTGAYVGLRFSYSYFLSRK